MFKDPWATKDSLEFLKDRMNITYTSRAYGYVNVSEDDIPSGTYLATQRFDGSEVMIQYGTSLIDSITHIISHHITSHHIEHTHNYHITSQHISLNPQTHSSPSYTSNYLPHSLSLLLISFASSAACCSVSPSLLFLSLSLYVCGSVWLCVCACGCVSVRVAVCLCVPLSGREERMHESVKECPKIMKMGPI